MNKQALVVDDDLVNRKLARAMLEHLGWSVTECETGSAALECVNASDTRPALFGCVLLDIGLPDMSGWEVCRQLREKRGSALFIVAYTAHMDEEDIARMLQDGFDKVLIKPVTLASMNAIF